MDAFDIEVEKIKFSTSNSSRRLKFTIDIYREICNLIIYYELGRQI